MIEINNLTDVEVDEVLVKKIIEKVLSVEGVRGNTDVSVAFIGPGRMRKLNKTYRKKNRVTDVLSFANVTVQFGKFKIGPSEKTEGLGEIIVCLREVAKNAKKDNKTQEQELMWVIVHGVLHLLEYDHERSEAEANRMKKKEEEYLARV